MRPELRPALQDKAASTTLLSLPAAYCGVAWEQSGEPAPRGAKSGHEEAAPPHLVAGQPQLCTAPSRPLHFLGNGQSEENKIPQETVC